MNTFIALICAVSGFFLVHGAWSLVKIYGRGDRRTVQQRLALLKEEGGFGGLPSILRKDAFNKLNWFSTFPSTGSWMKRLDLLFQQAGVSYKPATFISISVLAGVVCFYITSFLLGFLTASLFGLIVLVMPIVWIIRKKASRMEKFQVQLPEGLDLIARSLRAGHTFLNGMRMVAEEFEDPIGIEFGKTLDEINFGVSMEVALEKLVERVDCMDLKFFIICVNIQRETGGNLAEIIANIAHIIRERFKLKGRIQVLSAEGRLSALILILLPFGVVVLFNTMNPGYLQELIDHPLGNKIIAGTLAFMAVGIVVIKKMVAIKV